MRMHRYARPLRQLGQVVMILWRLCLAVSFLVQGRDLVPVTDDMADEPTHVVWRIDSEPLTD